MTKRIFLLFIAILFVFSAVLPTSIADAAEEKIKMAEQSKSAVLLERDTGAILFEKNSHKPLPPASMTKIMTMLLIMEAIEEKKLTWNEKIRTSEYAASMGGSQIFLEPGEEMTTREMLQGIAIGSANDASVAMAERIAGSEEMFVKKMNQKAKELGLKQTKFKNATGLPQPGHYSSAYDMAIMAKELLKHEGITKYTGTYEAYLRENSDKKFWLVNTNRLIRFYPGVDGLKTGFTNEAKYCLTATASKGNMRVIAVIFGAPTPKDRNAQITKMLDYGFHQYEVTPLYGKGKIMSSIPIAKGDKPVVRLETADKISVLMKKGEKKGKFSKDIHVKKDIQAPIKKGERLGELTIKQDGKVISKTPLLAKEDVNRASWWQFYKKVFHYFSKTDAA
ncbi:D-alanyl-D-alanine carboxypeptidase family protein [Pseudobacillus wudalianchiensis]|uniref:serine-type D-Ala-D-Ala carboxypeptidase n=1 Tax=Pseudobacillus wudalianchiensis TaxID=1743143 RepID=A0A1B9B9F3_9BACI|nr:D-alanyl-D-alanine carboxypeptidase family protein [Bacillus wudalianchiensis]OCA92701.1 D-alanyl-D-alanine carboxypeptidase [Bacillus wudalianchiensis]